MKDTSTISDDAAPTRELMAGKIKPRSKPMAEMNASIDHLPSLWGAHPGSVHTAQGVDLTAPVIDEDRDAERGVLHR